MKKTIVLVFYMGAASLCGTSIAQPPPNFDPALEPFYKSLTLPGHAPGWCCSQSSDCRPVEAKQENGQWMAFISRKEFGEYAPDIFLPVAPDHEVKNPPPFMEQPQSAVACYFNGEIRCFYRGPTMTQRMPFDVRLG